LSWCHIHNNCGTLGVVVSDYEARVAATKWRSPGDSIHGDVDRDVVSKVGREDVRCCNPGSSRSCGVGAEIGIEVGCEGWVNNERGESGCAQYHGASHCRRQP